MKDGSFHLLTIIFPLKLGYTLEIKITLFENQNILISGNISKEEILIRWEIEKIK